MLPLLNYGQDRLASIIVPNRPGCASAYSGVLVLLLKNASGSGMLPEAFDINSKHISIIWMFQLEMCGINQPLFC